MNITEVSLAQIQQLTPLMAEKEKAHGRIRELDAMMQRILGETPEPIPGLNVAVAALSGKSGSQPKPVRKTAPTAKPAAPGKKQRGRPPGSGAGKGTSKSSAPAPATPTAPVAPATGEATPVAPVGEIGQRVIGLLGEAGESGLSVKEMAARLEMKSPNLYNWFTTTGKKIGTIEKTGPAKYRLKP